MRFNQDHGDICKVEIYSGEPGDEGAKKLMTVYFIDDPEFAPVEPNKSVLDECES